MVNVEKIITRRLGQRRAKQEARAALWWLLEYQFSSGAISALISQKFDGEAARQVFDEIVAIQNKFERAAFK